MSSLWIATLTEMNNGDAIEQRLSRFVQMEEECFVVAFNQNMEKKMNKAWHECHIRINPFKFKGLVLLYENKFCKHLGKLKTHWLGPYLIAHITDAGAIKLHKIDGTYIVGMVNGSHLKPYYDGRDMPG